MESNKSKFLSRPTHDPKTGEPIKRHSKQYKKLVKKYGKPKHNKKMIEPQFINNDLLHNIMLRLDINTLKNLMLINKQAFTFSKNKHFWQENYVTSIYHLSMFII